MHDIYIHIMTYPYAFLYLNIVFKKISDVDSRKGYEDLAPYPLDYS